MPVGCRTSVSSALLGAFLSLVAAAAEPLPDSAIATAAAPRPLRIDLPLLDVPFNVEHGYSFPSMQQSVALTAGVTQATHEALGILWRPTVTDRSVQGVLANRRLGGLWASIVLFDALSPFPGWTHEEGHRAVLTNRGIDSHNDIYEDPFATMVSVSHVSDEDLVWLKAEYPADMVRLSEAGGEAQVELVLHMQKANFFDRRSSTYDLPSWWLNMGTVAFYVWYCSQDDVNRITEEETLKEDADISKRDIVGADYTSWVYDLFRPDEPYPAGVRGRTHPSGVGLDRYIQPSELAPEELRYLKLQGYLFLLNFLSPQMFGLDRFAGTDPITHRPCWWNVRVTHHLASFGTATGLHLLYQQGATNLGCTYFSYISRYKYWPGLALEWVRYPVRIAGRTVSFSAGASVWLQPRDQRFDSPSSQGGGWLSLGVACPLTRRLAWSIECDAKTSGWVAGNVFLDPAVQARTGLVLTLWPREL